MSKLDEAVKIAAPSIRRVRKATGLSLRDAMQLLLENDACEHTSIARWKEYRIKPLRFPDLSTAKEFMALEERVAQLEALVNP